MLFFQMEQHPSVHSFCFIRKIKGSVTSGPPCIKRAGAFPCTTHAASSTSQVLFFRTLAVRETGVSRHQGGPIEGPPETPVHHSTIVLRKWKYSFLSVYCRETSGAIRAHLCLQITAFTVITVINLLSAITAPLNYAFRCKFLPPEKWRI